MEYAYDYEKIDKFTSGMSPIGMIIGLAVGFVLICFLAYFYEKKKYGRKKKSKKKNKKHYKR